MKTIQHRKNEINAMGSGMSNYLQFLIHMNTQQTYKKIGEKHKGTFGLNNPPLFKEKFSKLKGGGFIKQQKVQKIMFHIQMVLNVIIRQN